MAPCVRSCISIKANEPNPHVAACNSWRRETNMLAITFNWFNDRQIDAAMIERFVQHGRVDVPSDFTLAYLRDERTSRAIDVQKSADGQHRVT